VVKKLTKMGNSLGVVIDKPILDILHITPDTPIELSTDGDRIILKPLRTIRHDEALEVGRRVMKKHATTLSKLAK
jgi:antitoxin component of MazEF toxin-antitoxin module